jgi:hypothetical protein
MTTKRYLRQNEDLPHCILVDIDGTVALKHPDRDIFDYNLVHKDVPNKPVIRTIQKLVFNDPDLLVFFCTGRDGMCHAATRKWLRKHLPFLNNEFQLFMRKENDMREDSVVKKEIYMKHFKNKYHIDCVFDDRNSVVKMWRSLGLLVYQVFDGDF